MSVQQDILMRRFVFQRNEDVSGTSGTGIVAEGVQFTDGTVAVRWRSMIASHVIYLNVLPPSTSTATAARQDLNGSTEMNTWPDGTPKSCGNAFSLSGKSNIGMSIQQNADKSRAVSASVNRMRANGKDVSTIPGLSDKSDRHERDPKRFLVAKNKRQV